MSDFRSMNEQMRALPHFDKLNRGLKNYAPDMFSTWLVFSVDDGNVSARDMGKWVRAVGWAYTLPRNIHERIRLFTRLCMKDDVRTKILTAWKDSS
jgi:hypothetical protein